MGSARATLESRFGVRPNKLKLELQQLKLRAHATGPQETPAAHSFENAKQTNDHQRNRCPQRFIGEDDAGNKQNGPGDSTGDAPLKTDVSLKKSGHAAT